MMKLQLKKIYMVVKQALVLQIQQLVKLSTVMSCQRTVFESFQSYYVKFFIRKMSYFEVMENWLNSRLIILKTQIF